MPILKALRVAEFIALAHVEVAKTWGVPVEKVAYSVGFNEDELPPAGTNMTISVMVADQKIIFRIRE